MNEKGNTQSGSVIVEMAADQFEALSTQSSEVVREGPELRIEKPKTASDKAAAGFRVRFSGMTTLKRVLFGSPVVVAFYATCGGLLLFPLHYFNSSFGEVVAECYLTFVVPIVLFIANLRAAKSLRLTGMLALCFLVTSVEWYIIWLLLQGAAGLLLT